MPNGFTGLVNKPRTQPERLDPVHFSNHTYGLIYARPNFYTPSVSFLNQVKPNSVEIAKELKHAARPPHFKTLGGNAFPKSRSGLEDRTGRDSYPRPETSRI